jgi:outer membrane protein assembly factor BamC
VLLSLTGCESTTFNGNKVDYKTSSEVKTTPLEVPPDLSQLPSNARYSIPGGVSAKTLGSSPGGPGNAGNAAGSTDIRLSRDGGQRWLSVKRSCNVVWPLVHAFWLDNGFVYTTDQKDMGLLETDWAENQANFPKDLLHRYLGKVINSLSSTGLRDRYRTRLDPVDDNTCEIYIAQRGISEEYADAAKITTTWKPRPSDPELENEFLKRMMVKLGSSTEFATKSVEGITLVASAKLTLIAGAPVVELTQGFDSAWRRLGVALDRGGFTVEDRDRKAGLYFVRFVDKPAEKNDVPWYKSMFTPSKPVVQGPQKYRLKLVSQDSVTKISVLNNAGDPDTGEIAKKIADILVQELK